MKYKHALFLNPYPEHSSNSTMRLFPPTGLEYVATAAKGFVEEITLLDLRYEKELSDINNLNTFIKKNNIDIICLSISWERDFDKVCQFINKIPDEILLVVGGYKATEKVEELFNNCPKVDLIARGEGEETIQDILTGMPYNDILGISYRKNGQLIHNSNRNLPDVEKVGWPDRDLRHNRYHLTLNGVDVKKIRLDTILTARGCPFNCKFCTFKLNPLGQKRNYAPRSVESVIQEIENLDSNIIMISDDNFCTDKKRAEKICDAIIERSIKKRFIAQVRIDIADNPKLLEKMVQAGFKVLLIGIESPHDWILKQLDKGFNSRKVRKAFSVLKEYPIFYNGYFIYGNIDESEEEMLYIGQFAKEIGVDIIAFHKLRIEKFSPLKEVIMNKPGYHMTDKGVLYSDRYDYGTLKKIGRKIKFSFYTPSRYLKIFKRLFFEVKFFTLSEIIAVFSTLPLVIKSLILREFEKGRAKDTFRRTFISNSR
jgi:radical SAM superfamily enzyme YgiQ (UPF0313 family)